MERGRNASDRIVAPSEVRLTRAPALLAYVTITTHHQCQLPSEDCRARVILALRSKNYHKYFSGDLQGRMA